MSLLSSLLLDDAPLNSSTDTLQCSADGQIAAVTRSAIYILTPDFNSKSESKSSSEVTPSRDAFSWSKTAIHDAEKARVWTDSND
ncbi:hypothetical protein FRC09_008398, partial [Ceratobasidium sp. 395]